MFEWTINRNLQAYYLQGFVLPDTSGHYPICNNAAVDRNLS